MPANATLHVEADAVRVLASVSSYLAHRGTQACVVGGYVRDALLGRASRDIDIAVAGDAEGTARDFADAIGGRFVLLDDVHHVARVVLMQDGLRWDVDFATMRGTIEEDLRKRDFTVNSMAVRLDELRAGTADLELIDPLDGAADLDERLMRAVSDSVFADDPGRLLRAFRMAVELGFSIDDRTLALIERDAGRVAGVAGERLREELGRILETTRSTQAVRDLDRQGLLDRLFPELAASKGVEQPKEHYWDVHEHSIEALAAVERLLAALNGENDLLDSLGFASRVREHLAQDAGSGLSRRALIKLAALLHDVAKPQTKAIHANGKMRFLGHAQQGAVVAQAMLERLRFSNREKKIVCKVIDQHLRPGHLSNAPELPTRRAIYRYFRDTDDVGIDTLFLSLADHLATRGPAFDTAAWLHHVRVTEYMLAKRFEDENVVSPPKLVDGRALMERFGLRPGPRVGILLEAVREGQASGEIKSEEDALDFVAKELGKHDGTER